MTASRTQVAWTRAYVITINRIAARAARAAGLAWDQLDTYNDDDVDRYARMAGPALTAASIAAAAAAGRYATLLAGGSASPPGASLGPVDFRQPFIATWSDLANGVSWDQATSSTGRTAATTLGFDTPKAESHQALEQALPTQRIVGWERVLVDGPNGPCDWCEMVSTQRYHTAASAAASHNRAGNLHGAGSCNCEPTPIYGDSDPGRVINTRPRLRITADTAS